MTAVTGRRTDVAPSAFSDAASKRLTVGRGITLSGEIRACDLLIVEGQVEATLSESRAVEISASGVFKGIADIESAEVSGLIEGELVVRNTLVIHSDRPRSGQDQLRSKSRSPAAASSRARSTCCPRRRSRTPHRPPKLRPRNRRRLPGRRPISRSRSRSAEEPAKGPDNTARPGLGRDALALSIHHHCRIAEGCYADNGHGVAPPTCRIVGLDLAHRMAGGRRGRLSSRIHRCRPHGRLDGRPAAGRGP